jgi:thioredoxin
MAVKELTKAEFLELVGDVEKSPKDWTYKGNKPCIVDFSAPWCGYCKRLDPILEELSDYYRGDIDIYKVDVDKELELETAFNIRTIPTLLFCKKDKEREMMLGTMGKPQLKELIQHKLL